VLVFEERLPPQPESVQSVGTALGLAMPHKGVLP
jgi:hypothetical protein